MTVLLLIAATGVVILILVSTAVLIPVYLFRVRLSTRPGLGWYTAISFLIGFLVTLSVYPPNDHHNELGTIFTTATLVGAFMGLFGALWWKSGIDCSEIQSGWSAIARVILWLYLGAFVVLGTGAIFIFLRG